MMLMMMLMIMISLLLNIIILHLVLFHFIFRIIILILILRNIIILHSILLHLIILNIIVRIIIVIIMMNHTETVAHCTWNDSDFLDWWMLNATDVPQRRSCACLALCGQRAAFTKQLATPHKHTRIKTWKMGTKREKKWENFGKIGKSIKSRNLSENYHIQGGLQ